MERLLEAATNVRASIDATRALLPGASAETVGVLQAVRYLADAVDLILAELTERAGGGTGDTDEAGKP